MGCSFVPPYLLRRIAATEGLGVAAGVASRCRDTLLVDETFRVRRQQAAATSAAPLVAPAAWTVHTADHTVELPGRRVRSAGEPATGYPAVDEAAYGVEGSLALFADLYGRRSYDDAGAPVIATVHYARNYDNAFWDGRQLVFGDGDGEIFERFTRPVDVLAHEFTHAVTQHSANLVYQDQPGALNESMSDVFAACLKQRLRGESAAEGDWLIGEDLFRPGIDARALRDMRHPGTAYDDPRLGKDPQPAHFDDFVVTTDDNGGVHLNSGIPNRAFHLAALAVGGSSARGAGRIWHAALTGGLVGPRTDFAGFAAATVAAAGEHAEQVRAAWAEVGVAEGATDRRPDAAAAPEGDVVEVRRSGGFTGRTTAGVVDLSRDDPRTCEVRSLVARIDLRSVHGSSPQPDMFVYSFRVGGAQVTVPEQQLTEELRRLASLVLDQEG